MSVKIPIDIETIPNQNPNCYKQILETVKKNYQAPSKLTKQQAAFDLDIHDPLVLKNYSKEELIDEWVQKFAPAECKDIAEKNWRDTSFDGGQGEVISCVFYDNSFFSFSRGLHSKINESDLINGLFSAIRKSCTVNKHFTQPFFIGHNVRFDLEFLWKRAVVLGIDPGFKLPFKGRHGVDFYCTMEAWAGHSKRIGQDKLAEILGIPQKPNDINGANVWDHILNGNEKRVTEYNMYDVDTVISIYRKLNFLKGKL